MGSKKVDSHLFPWSTNFFSNRLAFLCWDSLALLHRHLCALLYRNTCADSPRLEFFNLGASLFRNNLTLFDRHTFAHLLWHKCALLARNLFTLFRRHC